MKPKLAALYHFYYPDDVVSARLFQDLCEDLSKRGWDVEVWPSNRNCSNSSLNYSSREDQQGVSIRRLWRPAFSQASFLGRIFNSLWMVSGWCLRWIFYGKGRPQAVLIGTDPVLAVCAAIGIRFFDSKVKIAHWCFDLYPEAAVADGKLKIGGFIHQFSKTLMQRAYRACDVIADLGSCMRHQLEIYDSGAVHETIVPWAFYEPSQIQEPDLEERKKLFGDARLGIIYSGNFGLAHAADLTLRLAKSLKEKDIRFCFSVRGNAEKALRDKCILLQSSVSFTDFASESKLQTRLEAADIHMVSLKENWTGTVIPSKFFGALAAGRPVIFEGSGQSAIADWIRKYHVGWILNADSMDQVAEDLIRLCGEKEELKKLQENCRAIYQLHFCRARGLDHWNQILSRLC